jgi:hypothetical protein
MRSGESRGYVMPPVVEYVQHDRSFIYRGRSGLILAELGYIGIPVLCGGASGSRRS